MIPMRVFLDANLLFTAAHNPQGKSAFIIEMGDEGVFEVLTCPLAIEEARRNLELKFPALVKRLETFLKLVQIVPTISTGDCPIELPEKDRPIFLSALQAKATHLLTGDQKDFGRWMRNPRKTAGIMISSPAAFLSELE